MEVKRLHDEVVTLKTAIEEAINRGQKSTDDLNGIPRSGLVSKRLCPHLRERRFGGCRLGR